MYAALELELLELDEDDGRLLAELDDELDDELLDELLELEELELVEPDDEDELDELELLELDELELDELLDGSWYVNAQHLVNDRPSGLATRTFTVSAEPRVGVRALICVGVTESIVANPPSNITVSPAWKPWPTIVTVSSPLVEPVDGSTVVMAGPKS